MGPKYKVYILNAARERITQVKNLTVMDTRGNVLKYAKQLSGYGYCQFRIGKGDPVLSKFGNILEPWKYGVQVVRGNSVVWQGLIINNPHRKRNYIDVQAYGYLYRFKKLLVKRDAEQKPGDGKDNYRTFNTGTLAAAVQAVFTEGKAAAGSADILNGVSIGTIENPTFPSYFTKSDGTVLSGDWNFSADITLQFDYKTIFYVWQSLGIYSGCDFEITDDLIFNWLRRTGVKQPGLVFNYGRYGNVVDYDAPLKGERQVNDMMGIAADLEGNVLHLANTDAASVQQYGLLQGVEGFLDVKEKNALQVRLAEQARFITRPDSVINFVLSEKAHPLGRWDLGDTSTFKINDGVVQVNEERRITAYSVAVHNVGKELITMETNPDRSV